MESTPYAIQPGLAVSGLSQRPGTGRLKFLWVVLVMALVFAAMVPVDLPAQVMFAAIITPFMLLVRLRAREQGDDAPRAFVLVLSCFISLRYLFWRLFFTLNSQGFVSEIITIMLFVAELYAGFLHFTGIFVNLSPLRRPDRHLDMTQPVPSVDLLIPSYNESADLLEVTIRASRMMRYPQGKLHIYLLDDGGTDQKCSDPDPVKSGAARARRAELQALCKRLGIAYLTRARNEHAKAGNINAALQHTHGDLILILDADHVPAVDMLERTVPYFIDDADVFLVQTPHFMINSDPIDRNLLNAFRRMPAENEMFYLSIQNGLDAWDSSFFCGSAGLLRRKHLELIGGLSTASITEDCETALDLHALGFKSVYVSYPMVAGLAPESYRSYVGQRIRWAQGMTQILLLKNPLFKSGLSWPQKLCYLRNCMFWLFPFARLIFLLAPLLYLILGLHVYNATLPEILAYALPHLIASFTVTSMLYRRTRWPLVSELYEILQSIYTLPALLHVLIHPHKPVFAVTPKHELRDHGFVSPLAKPFQLLLLATILAFAAGIWRAEAFPQSRDLTIVVLFWNLFNCILLFAAFGALLERRQRRAASRVPVFLDGGITLADGKRIACNIDNLSVGGAQLALGDDAPALTEDTPAVLEAYLVPMKRQAKLNIVLRSVLHRRGRILWGVQFHPQSDSERDDIVALMYADSNKWQQLMTRRTRPMPFFKGVAVVLGLIRRPLFYYARKATRQVADAIRLFWRRVNRRRSIFESYA